MKETSFDLGGSRTLSSTSSWSADGDVDVAAESVINSKAEAKERITPLSIPSPLPKSQASSSLELMECTQL